MDACTYPSIVNLTGHMPLDHDSVEQKYQKQLRQIDDVSMHYAQGQLYNRSFPEPAKLELDYGYRLYTGNATRRDPRSSFLQRVGVRLRI